MENIFYLRVRNPKKDGGEKSEMVLFWPICHIHTQVWDQNDGKRACHQWQPLFSCLKSIRPGAHYPRVTWAHVMLRVQLGCETRINIEFYGADSHFCHFAYVMWSHVERWSAHVPARLSYFCCRTHFVTREVTSHEMCACDQVTQAE
jgi:hypothetical protein